MSAPLRETLLLLRARTHRHAQPTLSESELATIECDLNGQLPSDLLATMTSLGWSLAELVAQSEHAWSQGLDRGYVVFARGPEEVWCAALSGSRHEPARVGVWDGEGSEPILDCGMNRYLRRRYDMATPSPEEVAAAADDGFCPGLVPTPVAASWATHVFHPKFGDGVVVQEIRDGNHKLVVDFASGRRTLLARFCVPREVAA